MYLKKRGFLCIINSQYSFGERILRKSERMICYNRLFDLMKKQGKLQKDIREEKIIGQETLRKLKIGTGVLEEYDYMESVVETLDDGTEKIKKIKTKKLRETSIDTKSIESLCVWLNCQPNDIMEVIPNTWENAERLCQILGCTKDELRKKLVMPEK